VVALKVVNLFERPADSKIQLTQLLAMFIVHISHIINTLQYIYLDNYRQFIVWSQKLLHLFRLQQVNFSSDISLKSTSLIYGECSRIECPLETSLLP